MIQVKNLSKSYGKHVAVKDVSFTIKKGEIVGLLGPNGAGKSTSMNIITGCLSTSKGSVLIDGIDILENPIEAKKRIGYLPELPPLCLEMTVNEYLNFVCDLKKVEKKTKKNDLKKIKELVKIEDVENRVIHNLSKGYRQRVGVAQALIGNPPVLILDEPTVGLDPKQIIEMRNLIKSLGEAHTVILSSHILSEVNAICERLIIINKGVLVAEGTPEELSKNLSPDSRQTIRVVGVKEKVISVIEAVEGVKTVVYQGVREKDTVDVIVEAQEDRDIRKGLFCALSDNALPIYQMRPLGLTIEDIFLQVTNLNKGEGNKELVIDPSHTHEEEDQ